MFGYLITFCILTYYISAKINPSSLLKEMEKHIRSVNEIEANIEENGCNITTEDVSIRPVDCDTYQIIQLNLCSGLCRSFTIPLKPNIYCYSRCIVDIVIKKEIKCKTRAVMTYDQVLQCKCSPISCHIRRTPGLF